MPHRRSTGKLETKIARNYCHENSEWRTRNNDPDELNEKMFKGTAKELEGAVLAKVKGTRTGTIPDYPQGLVISDQTKTGYFNLVTFFDETFISDFRVLP